MRPAMACPAVTAGLKWPPETYPKASIAAVTASPAAREAESGLDCGMVNSGTPRPATTTKNVPRASADNRAGSPGRGESSGAASGSVGLSQAWSWFRNSFVGVSAAVCQRSLDVRWTLAQRPSAMAATALAPSTMMPAAAQRIREAGGA